MYLNSSSTASACSSTFCGTEMFASEMPSAKLSFNINAFNGNTTNFNRSQPPCSKSISTSTILPVQPSKAPFGFYKTQPSRVGLVMPM